jgi:hypothetical protein
VTSFVLLWKRKLTFRGHEIHNFRDRVNRYQLLNKDSYFMYFDKFPVKILKAFFFSQHNNTLIVFNLHEIALFWVIT